MVGSHIVATSGHLRPLESLRAREESDMGAHVEYIGFKARESTREYAMRVRSVGSDDREFTLVIDNAAFLENRVRYQDAPEVCFLKLLRELESCTEGQEPARRLKVSDPELEEYREAHSPKSRLKALDKPRA